MRSQMVWLLPASVLLVCGMIGCGAKLRPTGGPEGLGAGAEDIKAVVSEQGVEEELKATVEKAVAAQKECSQTLGSPVEITNSIGMKFALIPAGEFMMGSLESDLRAADGEKPRHRVRMTEPFYLGVYEVTQAEYEKVMEKNRSWFSKGGGGADSMSGKDTSGYPVEEVSWDEAVEFCKRLSAKEGKTYRLPSEAEWEYACRAGTTTKWYCGDNEDELGRVAWYGDNSGNTTHPVGAKEANAWGLFDMHGNVYEWCADRYDSDYYANSPPSDPPGSERGEGQVYRGGGWPTVAESCRSACRYGLEAWFRDDYLGFRVARSPSGK